MQGYDIGLIGLAVMGENLVLNMERNGFKVAVFNRTVKKVDDFLNARAKEKNDQGVSYHRGTDCKSGTTTKNHAVGQGR